MVTKILIGAAALVVPFALVVATRPSTFHVERSITIAAPPERAFALVNDFHAWRAWSPWEGKDPAMQRTFEGPRSGAGASYAWTGNSEVGEGRMTIEKSDEPSQLSIELEFIRPFAATNRATYTFSPTPEGTQVTWAMDGRNNFVAKAIQVFMDTDQLLGPEFERGLRAMKTAAEAASKGTNQ